MLTRLPRAKSEELITLYTVSEALSAKDNPRPQMADAVAAGIFYALFGGPSGVFCPLHHHTKTKPTTNARAMPGLKL